MALLAAGISAAGSALGAASSLFGASQAASNARQANRVALAQLQAQQDQARFLNDRGNDALAQEAQIREYIRQLNETNSGLFMNQRDYERQISAANLQALTQNRDWLLNRQSFLDGLAQSNQAREIDAYNRNTGLAQSEREQALALLEQARQQALAQREWDIQDQERNRQQRLAERQFQVDQLSRAQAIAQREQDVSVADRQRVIDGASDMRARLNGALADMGQLAPVRRFTEQDIAAEGDIRAQEYRRAVDRAAQFASSQNEAALISAGIDASSTGAARRAEVGARLAPMYQDAYARARSDATQYIQGKQSILLAGQNGEIGRRNAILGELLNSIGAPLQVEARLPQLVSAQGPLASQAVNASGVWNQQIGDANNYRAPVAIGSAMVSPNISLGAANTLTINPAVQQAAATIGVNTQFQQLPFTRPNEFFGQAASLMGGAATNSMQFANAQNGLAANAATAAGQSWTNAAQRLSGFGQSLSNWWNSPPSGAGAFPSTYGTAQNPARWGKGDFSQGV